MTEKKRPPARSGLVRQQAPLVLASGSPRRRQLLAGLGLEFTVVPPDV
ncbi:MAG: Maf family protein, partial [Deltaproteobacteria bacterium]|nr:Maf family protein [Deltaproteobacteria bacterium]